VVPVLALAGVGCTVLWPDGIGTRTERRRNEYQFNGTGAASFHGTRPKYLLFLRYILADRAWHHRRLDLLSCQPGGWLWPDRGGVRACLRQRSVANENRVGNRFHCGLKKVQQFPAILGGPSC